MDVAPSHPHPAAGFRSARLLRVLLEQAPEIRPISLRFEDPAMEADYQERYIRDSLPFIRFAHVLGS